MADWGTIQFQEAEALRKRVAGLSDIITEAQSILAKHLEPGGPDEKATISELLGLLDGPRARRALQQD